MHYILLCSAAVYDVFYLGIQTVEKPNSLFVRSVSQRFEPSSRTLLIGEQPNPWGLTLFSYITISADYTFIHPPYGEIRMLAV
jgi:hypothetical protein